MEIFRSLQVRLYLAAATLKDREEGQAMVEYALLLSLIAVASIAILTTLGKSVAGIFSNINNAL